MTNRRFPPPWTVESIPSGLKVGEGCLYGADRMSLIQDLLKKPSTLSTGKAHNRRISDRPNGVRTRGARAHRTGRHFPPRADNVRHSRPITRHSCLGAFQSRG